VVKYAPLTAHLGAVDSDIADVTLPMARIDAVVGGLPPTAWRARTWWANNSQVQARAWRAAGWHVAGVDFGERTVRFARGARGGTYAARRAAERAQAAPATPGPAAVLDAHAEWHWECNVQAAVVTALAAAGWRITGVADTATGQRGVDITAKREERALLVEVKGYPSTVYARGTRAGQPKPTHPSVQAKHWLAEAVLQAMRLRHRRPEAAVAIALPAHPRYAALLAEVRTSLAAIGVAVLEVAADGAVTGLDGL
jgi:hypothetical protein